MLNGRLVMRSSTNLCVRATFFKREVLSGRIPVVEQLGLLNISLPWQINAPEETAIISWRECSKKSVQQGRSPFDARRVHGVREHGKMARTPLAAFFNIPKLNVNGGR